MSEYIEKKHYCDIDKFAQSICENMTLTEDEANKFIVLLWEQKRCDVVEVVRCEECRNLVVTETNTGFAYRCRRNGLKERDIHPKCFCCYGEKYTKEGVKMTPQETIKQLNILLSRERYLLGCSSDEQQRSQMIEALEVAKRAVEESEVKHGEWKLFSSDKIGNAFICSICGNIEVTENFETTPLDNNCNYCSECGAKMDKE